MGVRSLSGAQDAPFLFYENVPLRLLCWSLTSVASSSVGLGFSLPPLDDKNGGTNDQLHVACELQ